MWEVLFDEDWLKYYRKTNDELKKRFLKKAKELKTDKKFKHLKHGLPYFVLELGKNGRVLFIEDEKSKTRILVFIGDHKEYEKFIGI